MQFHNLRAVALCALASAAIALTGHSILKAQTIGGGGGVTQSYVDNAISTLAAAVPGLAPVQSVNSNVGAVTVQPGNFVGTFTVGTLPACNGTTTKFGSIAYVTDLGGGANNVKCIANFWQHFSLGTPQQNSNTTTSTIIWTPLVGAPIQQLTGTIAALNTVTMQIQTSNLYPGYQGCVIAPPSILGVLNLQVGVAGTLISILGGSHNCYVWNGTALVQIS